MCGACSTRLDEAADGVWRQWRRSQVCSAGCPLDGSRQEEDQTAFGTDPSFLLWAARPATSTHPRRRSVVVNGTLGRIRLTLACFGVVVAGICGCRSGVLDQSSPDLSVQFDGMVAQVMDAGVDGGATCFFRVPDPCFTASDCGGGSWTKCQLGACCPGEIDPITCICRCNGAPPCTGNLQCCTAKGAESDGGLACRHVFDCRG